MAAVRASELECQAAIVEAAQLSGWRVHAERASRRQSGSWATAIQGDAGFPDLLLCRPPRVMFVELKRRPYRVSPDQHDWLAVLGACPAVEARVVWVPEGMDAFIAELVRR